MSTLAAITKLRHRIAKEFYAGKTAHETARDSVAITKTLARYGHECQNRGWQFNLNEISGQLNEIIDQMAKHSENIKFFPIYFEKAMEQWFVQKAETFSAKARSMENITAKLLKGIDKVSGKAQSSDTDDWAAVYEALRVGKKKEPKKLNDQQMELL